MQMGEASLTIDYTCSISCINMPNQGSALRSIASGGKYEPGREGFAPRSRCRRHCRVPGDLRESIREEYPDGTRDQSWRRRHY